MIPKRAVLPLPWSCPPLSMNGRGASRGAAFARGRKIREIRAATLDLAHAARLPKNVTHATVQLHYRPRGNGRRDTDNLVATLKPIADGLAAGRPARIGRTGKPVPALIGYGLVPDDTPQYMAKPEPIIHPAEKGMPGAMWLEITWED